MNVLGYTQDSILKKLNLKKDLLRRLGRLTKAVSDNQNRWSKDGPMVSSDIQRWARWIRCSGLGQRKDQDKVGPVDKYFKIQIQDSRSRCEPEELEEYQDGKKQEGTEEELGNQAQDIKTVIIYIKLSKPL